jgi:hypothetical protein
MGQSVTLELSEAEYAALQEMAEASGQSPDQWAAERLREQLPPVAGDDLLERIYPETLERFRQQAEAEGRPLEEIAAEFLRSLYPKRRSPVSREERAAALAEMRQYITSPGFATGTDNEQIDADLAREYGDDHRSLYYPELEKDNL